jgi:exosortase
MFFADLYREKPHYEFVPFVLLASACFFWSRWPGVLYHVGRRERLLIFGLLAASLACLGGGTAFISPWLGIVGALLALGSWLVWMVGKDGLSALLPCWLLLWAIVPPPLQFDLRIIGGMQNLTSGATAMLLDLVKMPYLRFGNIFEINRRSLFVAEACSGIHSQLVLIAGTAILCVALRRSLLHSLLLIVSALAWSTGMNILRVFVVVVAESRGIALGEGWMHDALGYAVLLFGLGLVYSTDQLISFFLSPIPDEWITETLGAIDDPDDLIEDRDLLKMRLDERFCRLWNRLSGSNAHAVAKTSDREAGVFDIGTRPMFALATLFFAFGLGGWVLLRSSRVPPYVANAETLFARIGESLLPEKIGDLSRRKHLPEQRDRGNSAGMYSHQWQYASPTELIEYSMDFPFTGWHELTVCYLAQGWKVVSRREIIEPATEPLVEVILKRGLNEWGILHFAIHDAEKRPLRLALSIPDRFLARLNSNPLVRILRSESRVAIDLPTYQFQQFLRKPLEPDDKDIAGARSTFRAALSLWLLSDVFDASSAAISEAGRGADRSNQAVLTRRQRLGVFR